jgi:DNA-binding NtrC family response regulator
LDDHAQRLLERQRWSGNIRQLRNVAEQLSVLEQERAIGEDVLKLYLPSQQTNLPAIIDPDKKGSDFGSEREILYKVLFDMKSDLNDLKQLTLKLMNGSNSDQVRRENEGLIEKIYGDTPAKNDRLLALEQPRKETYPQEIEDRYDFAEEIQEEETLSLQDKELELIIKALDRNNGKRKAAAAELGISERTLYRKIKQFDIEG